MSSNFAQMRFILANPAAYADTLIRFLGGYLDPAKAGGFLTSTAYMGNARGREIILMALAVAAFTDRCGAEVLPGTRKGGRALLLFLLFGTLCMVATSMYISFTPVGKNDISGCQPRYLIPLIFPAMLLIGSGRIRNGANRAAYNGILFAVLGCVSFTAVLERCIALYG